MNAAEYSSSTLFSFILMAVIVIALLVFIIHYVVKLRVAKTTERYARINSLYMQSLDMGDLTIAYLSLADNKFYNFHGDRLKKAGDEGITYEYARSLVHPDDMEAYDQFIDSFRSGKRKEGTLDYKYNSVFDGSSAPIWHHITSRAVMEYAEDGTPSSILLTMSDNTDEARVRQMGDDMAEKYQQLFEDSIIGISYYNADGYLIDCNKVMREICHFESRYDSAFFDSCIYDLATYPSVSREKVEEYWGCTKVVMPSRDIDMYVELHVHPILDAKGKLQYIAMAARDITEERKLYLQSRQNDQQILKASEEIRHYEEQLRYLLENSKMHVWRSTFENGKIEFLRDLYNPVVQLDFPDFVKTLQTDEQEVAMQRLTLTLIERPRNSSIITRPFKNLLEQDDKVHWYNMSSIPSYDDEGRQIGYFGLIRDVTELIEEQEMLKRETERANDSDHMKSVFLANMTHEIRTPLNAIVGFSDLLQAIEAPEEKREMMRIIRNNCDMLLRLINDFLAISSIESDGVTLTPTTINFQQSFDDLCQSLAQRVTDSPVEFINDNANMPSGLTVTVDMERISQVITNFVTNAVKYTAQGHIKVGYRVEEREGSRGLYLFCEDTGSGIPAEDQERIFERFVKLNDYIQGTGLGLSICKAIAERLGGNIGVESEVGKGSTFWLWVPCEIEE